MKKKDISVIVTAYNVEAFIHDAIDSLINQSFDAERYQIFVINDGSTDATAEKLAKYQGIENIAVYHNGQNQGIANAANTCLGFVDTEFVMRFDADDVAETDLISDLYAGIGDHTFCHPDMTLFYNDAPDETIYYPVKSFPYFFAAGVLFRSDIFKTCSYSDLFWEEFDLYLQIFEVGGTYKHLPKALFKHRIHSSNMTSNAEAVARGFKEIESKWGEAILSKYGFTQEAVRGAYDYYFKRPSKETL